MTGAPFNRYETIEEAVGFLLLRHVSGRCTVVGVNRGEGYVHSGMPLDAKRGDDDYYGPISDDGVDHVSELYSRGYARMVFRQRTSPKERKSLSHDCWEHAFSIEWDGALGHGWECDLCGELLQVG
jgi:hypothetical protein